MFSLPVSCQRSCRQVAVAVAAAVAATAKSEGVASSAAIACMSELGRSRERNEDCLENLQYDPQVNWQKEHQDWMTSWSSIQEEYCELHCLYIKSKSSIYNMIRIWYIVDEANAIQPFLSLPKRWHYWYSTCIYWFWWLGQTKVYLQFSRFIYQLQYNVKTMISDRSAC
jgi:hypothetical protein